MWIRKIFSKVSERHQRSFLSASLALSSKRGGHGPSLHASPSSCWRRIQAGAQCGLERISGTGGSQQLLEPRGRAIRAQGLGWGEMVGSCSWERKRYKPGQLGPRFRSPVLPAAGTRRPRWLHLGPWFFTAADSFIHSFTHSLNFTNKLRV